MLRKLFLFVVLLLALVVGIAFILPREISVSRSITIAAPSTQIYPLVADLKTWPEWTVFERDMTDVQNTFSSVTIGAGATWSWKTNRGNGSLTIDKADPQKGVDYTMNFEGMNPGKGHITFVPSNGATTVTWHDDFDLGHNPVFRWMGLMMKGIVGKMFEENLANLKAHVEKGATPAPVEASGKK